MAEDITDDKAYICFSHSPFAGVTGKKQLRKQIEDFQDLFSCRQIGGINEIYACIVLISVNDFFDQVLHFFIR